MSATLNASTPAEKVISLPSNFAGALGEVDADGQIVAHKPGLRRGGRAGGFEHISLSLKARPPFCARLRMIHGRCILGRPKVVGFGAAAELRIQDAAQAFWAIMVGSA
ncbi:MAG: hypothetical protein ACLSHC_14830 [Bilophila wadsworthia]